MKRSERAVADLSLAALDFPRPDDRYFFDHAYGDGWEELARTSALSACRKYRRAIDVGAHIGLHSRMLRRRFLCTHAFEPQQECHACLLRNVPAARFSAHRVGIGRKAGIGFVPRRTGRDSIHGNVLRLKKDNNLERVPIVNIDSFDWSDVDLIHIAPTADWAEVLRGAQETLKRTAPVIWITTAGAAEHVNAALSFANEGTEIHYRCIHADDGAMILQAEAQGELASASSLPELTMISGSKRHVQYALLKQPSGEDVPKDVMSNGLLGRTIYPAKTRMLATDGGPQAVTVFYLAGSGVVAGHDYILPNGVRGKLTSKPELCDIDSIITEDVSAVLTDQHVRISIGARVASICDVLSVSAIPQDENTEIHLLHKKIEEIENLSDVVTYIPTGDKRFAGCRIRLFSDSANILDRFLPFRRDQAVL